MRWRCCTPAARGRSCWSWISTTRSSITRKEAPHIYAETDSLNQCSGSKAFWCVSGSGSCYFRRQQKTIFFLLITFWRYNYIIFQRLKVQKKSQNSRNQGFLLFLLYDRMGVFYHNIGCWLRDLKAIKLFVSLLKFARYQMERIKRAFFKPL